MDLWTHFWTLYFEGKIRDLKVKIELYTTRTSDLVNVKFWPSMFIGGKSHFFLSIWMNDFKPSIYVQIILPKTFLERYEL